MTTARSDRGQATVLTVIFLVALLGAVAMVLDVGSWFREQRDTQSTADATALAAAQALPESPGTANALASEYLAKNGGGTTQVSFSSQNVANDTVTVKVQRDAPGFFAKFFGIDSVTVHAKASARAGNLDEARYAAPIAVDKKHPLLQCKPLPCFGVATTLDLEKTGPGAFRLLNLDGSKGGTGGQISVDWILRGYDDYMDLGWYGSDPGAAFNDGKVKDAMKVRVGDELLFPVYDQVKEEGANFTYRVVGWVGFVVTSFKGNGSHGTIDGSFVRVIWEGIQSKSGTAEDFGVRGIQLVD
jgi:secretion/DNA translocation related TadE-like protein